MNHRILHRVGAAMVAASTAIVLLAAPAHADPASGNATTVEMTLPGPVQPSSETGSGNSYQPPPVTLTEQGGSEQDGGGGVDRDGTNGMVDPDGTEGTITGPLIRATPAVRARPAPQSPRVDS
ncbi:MAG: hypothetical protein FGM50_01920 [Mycobacterium sp.]|nr:hypothetical protein [Mycobacterium sp.]